MKIRDKLIIAIFGLTAVPILCISLLAYIFAKSTIHENIIEKQELVINEVAEGIQALNKDAAAKVLLLKDLPPLAGIIRSYPTGVDPLGEVSLEQWIQRYQAILVRLVGVDERIDQVHFINENGMEVVRVNQGKDGPEVVASEELQDKSQRYYYREAMALEADQIYVSELNLNRENEEIEIPFKPVVRYAMPVVDSGGLKRGIIILNYRMDIMLNDFLAGAEFGHRAMTDEKGNFIFHPDQKKQFSIDRGSGHNYFSEQPELIRNTAEREFKIHYDAEEGEYRIWKKIYYNPNDQNKYWIIFSILPEKVLFASLYRLRDTYVLSNIIVLAIIIPIIYMTAMSLSRPIERLKLIVDEASKGGRPDAVSPELLKRSDEIGILARSYNDMIRKLTDARLDLESKVMERTAQLQQAIKTAENNEKRFQQFFEMLPDAIVMVNKSGEIVLVNAMTEKLFGYQRDELIGQKIEVLIPQRYMHDHTQHRNDYVNNPMPRQMALNLDIYAIRKNGSEFAAEINLNPIKIDNELLVSSSVRDISERKSNEIKLNKLTSDLKRSNEELEQFAYVASHDLQEPLRMVASYTQLLAKRLQGKLDEKTTEYINYAVDGANRMQRLISDLLSFSRVSTRGEAFADVDCNVICKEVVDNLQIAIEKNKANVTFDELPVIYGDRTQLLSLFQNLIGNSVKFRSAKDPEVYVSAADRVDAWEFSVRDNGIGIDPKYRERIFIIFERLHGNHQFEGTGIGLAVCKKIVERHGGRIWVESQIGQGTVFYFTIPKKEHNV